MRARARASRRRQWQDELTGLRFLWIGDFVIWSPYVLLIAAAAQIPVWFGLTVRTYCRHNG